MPDASANLGGVAWYFAWDEKALAATSASWVLDKGDGQGWRSIPAIPSSAPILKVSMRLEWLYPPDMMF